MKAFPIAAILLVLLGVLVGSGHARAGRARRDHVVAVRAMPGLRRTRWREFWRALRYMVLAGGVLIALFFAIYRWDNNGS